jgi:hypothetical protein
VLCCAECSRGNKQSTLLEGELPRDHGWGRGWVVVLLACSGGVLRKECERSRVGSLRGSQPRRGVLITQRQGHRGLPRVSTVLWGKMSLFAVLFSEEAPRQETQASRFAVGEVFFFLLSNDRTCLPARPQQQQPWIAAPPAGPGGVLVYPIGQ